MKKLLSVIFVLITFQSFAQVKLGVKVSPSFVFNRVKIDSDSLNVTNDGSGFRPMFGLIADIPVAENYSFSTGIGYISKTIHLKIDPVDGTEVSQKYIAQYIQIPLTIKLFTNEVSIDKKIYFQTGFNAEIQVYNENKSDGEDAIEKFNAIDFPLVFAAGSEINLGTHTVLVLGVTYQRGMINVSKRESFESNNFSVKNDLLGLEIGLKF